MTVQSITQTEDQICCYRSINSTGVRVLWEITSACNVKCQFCLVERKGSAVSLEKALDFADQLIECGVEKFLISGGEPLLYKDIEKLLQYLLSKNVLVKLLTNGTIHNEKIFNLINQYPNLEVSISVHSIETDKANGIYGIPGSWEKILQTIKRIPKKQLFIITTFSTFNDDHIEDIIEWAVEKQIKCISITNVFQDVSNKARFFDSCLNYRSEEHRIRQLFDLIQRKREEYAGVLTIRTTQFQDQDNSDCGAGRSVLYLDSKGRLLPCTLTHNQLYNNLVNGMSIKTAYSLYNKILPKLPRSFCEPMLQGKSDIATLVKI